MIHTQVEKRRSQSIEKDGRPLKIALLLDISTVVYK